jgi:1-phosphatidylinositol-3-phosphate 5-kinase
MKGFPLPLCPLCDEFLKISVRNDTLFFEKQEIIDYSILVGLDEEKKELIVGIIDYLHQYTWDKQIETGVKSLVSEPTVISPQNYRKRFQQAIERYFIGVPH